MLWGSYAFSADNQIFRYFQYFRKQNIWKLCNSLVTSLRHKFAPGDQDAEIRQFGIIFGSPLFYLKFRYLRAFQGALKLSCNEKDFIFLLRPDHPEGFCVNRRKVLQSCCTGLMLLKKNTWLQFLAQVSEINNTS